MKKFRKHFRYGEKGFTLIELLVVIAILGVLAAVVVPNVSKFMGKGKAEAGLTELHSVQTAVTALMADTGIVKIPGTLAAAGSPEYRMTYFPTDSNTDNVSLFSASGTKYLQKAESEYWYSCLDDGTIRGWWTEDGSGGTENEIGVNEP